jgi:hypothetical protein
LSRSGKDLFAGARKAFQQGIVARVPFHRFACPLVRRFIALSERTASDLFMSDKRLIKSN